MLAAGLVWLVLLAFPAAHLLVAAPLAAATLPVVAMFCVALLAYLRAVWVIARQGAPWLCPVELAIIAVTATVLPLLFGGVWFGATVFLAALVGLSWPGWRAVIGVTAATVLSMGTGLASAPPEPQLLAVLLTTPLAGVVAVVVVHQIEVGRELSRLTAEAERLRLARELHDSVKQHAFVAAMEIGAVRGGGPDAAEHLDAAAAAVTEVQRCLSGVLDELRPARGELAPALRRLVADFSTRTGLPVEVELSGCDGVPAEPLLPVAVEALSNVERHAAASTVTLRVHAGELVVRDDGVGFDAGTAGHGLAGMRERLTERGGSLNVRSGSSGTTVRAVPAMITVLLADDHALVRRGVHCPTCSRTPGRRSWPAPCGRPHAAKLCCTGEWPLGWWPRCTGRAARCPTRSASAPTESWRCSGCSRRACPTGRSRRAW